MNTYCLSLVPDDTLKRDLAAYVASERRATALVLAHIAEFDSRKLYVPAAYPSMYAYCLGELHMSEDVACNYIRAARAALAFPAIFPALADGQLQLRAVVMLAPHLTPENAEQLVAEASGKSKSEIERLLAQRFPRPDLPTQVEPIAMPEQFIKELSVPGRIEVAVTRPKVTPLSPQRFALQVTIDEETRDNLLYGQALAGHRLDLAEALRHAAAAWVREMERKKFAKTSRPRRGPRWESVSPRHVSAHVKREVWERDGGQCTFVSERGRRCDARARLEFDHIVPVARGGEATAENIRIRCRAHNQLAAEQAFGSEFMNRKREEAQRRAEQAEERGVRPWLRQLGFRADEARRAAAYCESMPDAPLEERLKAALCFLAPPHRRVGAAPGRVAR